MFKLPTLIGLLLVLAGAALVLKQALHVDLPCFAWPAGSSSSGRACR
jgi:hypothetical protein